MSYTKAVNQCRTPGRKLSSPLQTNQSLDNLTLQAIRQPARATTLPTANTDANTERGD